MANGSCPNTVYISSIFGSKTPQLSVPTQRKVKVGFYFPFFKHFSATSGQDSLPHSVSVLCKRYFSLFLYDFYYFIENIPATGPAAAFGGEAIVLSRLPSSWMQIITDKTKYFCMIPISVIIQLYIMQIYIFFFYTLPHTFTLKIP